MNTLLREHLDKANEVNLALKEDVGKLTADWMRAREELDLKESEWRSEREVRIGCRNANVVPDSNENMVVVSRMQLWDGGLSAEVVVEDTHRLQ